MIFGTDDSRSSQLLSRACTTGLFDFVWGELWLTDDVLARVASTLSETKRTARELTSRGNRFGPTVHATDAQSVAPNDFSKLISEHPRTRLIPLAKVRRARVRRGLFNASLRVRLEDGSRVTLLWLKADPATEVLSQVFATVLDTNADGRPWSRSDD
jgi:hypothetical protein